MKVDAISKMVKIYLPVSYAESEVLDKTISTHKAASNYVAKRVYKSHNYKMKDMSDAYSSHLRDRYHLKPQQIHTILKSINSKCKELNKDYKWKRISYAKKEYEMEWKKEYLISDTKFYITTVAGRMSYEPIDYFRYFGVAIYTKFGTAKLMKKKGSYYLHVPVELMVDEEMSKFKLALIKVSIWFLWLPMKYSLKRQLK